MTEFRDQELPGARFEKSNLRGASFTDVYLNGAQFRDVILSDAQYRMVHFHRVRMRGVELHDVDIYGEVENVVINGVEVSAYVEAELDRRMPERAKMRPDDADGFREAWALLERLWEGTVERARTFPEAELHRQVGDEWSFIQTLRHLGFATSAWVSRMILGNASPWHPLDLPWDEAPGWDGIPWDRDAQPSLDEVLALRRSARRWSATSSPHSPTSSWPRPSPAPSPAGPRSRTSPSSSASASSSTRSGSTGSTPNATSTP